MKSIRYIHCQLLAESGQRITAIRPLITVALALGLLRARVKPDLPERDNLTAWHYGRETDLRISEHSSIHHHAAILYKRAVTKASLH